MDASMTSDDTTPEVDTEAGAEAGTKTRSAMLHKKRLVDLVAASSGVKKKAVKSVVEAALAEMAAALARGDVLSVPPLGRITVNKMRQGQNKDIMVLRVKRAKPGETAADEDDLSDDAVE